MVHIVFLGRSIDGIIRDLKAAMPIQDSQILVIGRDQESLAAPAGFEYTEVSKFQPVEVQYAIVANGGTAAQLVSVLLKVERAGRLARVLDLQRDGLTVLV